MSRKRSVVFWCLGVICAYSSYHWWKSTLVIHVAYPGIGVISDFSKKARALLEDQGNPAFDLPGEAEFYIWLDERPSTLEAEVSVNGVNVESFELVEGRFVSALAPANSWVLYFRNAKPSQKNMVVDYKFNGRAFKQSIYATYFPRKWSTRLFRIEGEVEVSSPELAIVRDLKVINFGRELRIPQMTTHVFVDARHSSLSAVVGRGTIN